MLVVAWCIIEFSLALSFPTAHRHTPPSRPCPRPTSPCAPRWGGGRASFLWCGPQCPPSRTAQAPPLREGGQKKPALFHTVPVLAVRRCEASVMCRYAPEVTSYAVPAPTFSVSSGSYQTPDLSAGPLSKDRYKTPFHPFLFFFFRAWPSMKRRDGCARRRGRVPAFSSRPGCS